MNNVKEEIMHITQSVSRLQFLRNHDFPRIALYMEQVTQFFEDALNSVRRHPSEKLLTKTMINNYTKEGILHRPKNKKYDRIHLIKLMYIFLFKHVLAMQDIKSMFNILEHDNTMDVMYECLLDEIDDYRDDYEKHVQDNMERAEKKLMEQGICTDENLKVLTIMRLLMESVANKTIAERLIDMKTKEDALEKEK